MINDNTRTHSLVRNSIGYAHSLHQCGIHEIVDFPIIRKGDLIAASDVGRIHQKRELLLKSLVRVSGLTKSMKISLAILSNKHLAEHIFNHYLHSDRCRIVVCQTQPLFPLHLSRIRMHLGRIFFLVDLAIVAAQMHQPRALQDACSECHSNSPGTQCQGPLGGICYNTNAQTGQCPAGTTLCTDLVETAATCRDLGRGDIDEGCNVTYPVCVTANGGEVIRGNLGHHCAYCINSQQPNDVNQVGIDDGCSANVEGKACAVCYNSIAADTDPSDIDDGCSPTAPVCVNDAGESPALWTPGTVCVANCFDTSRDDADEGVSCCVVASIRRRLTTSFFFSN